MFNGTLFVSKYLLFIGYIQNALIINFHTIFIIVRNLSAPVINDHRGVTGETVARHMTDVAVKVLMDCEFFYIYGRMGVWYIYTEFI